MVRKANARMTNVDFVQTTTPESSSHLKQRDIMCTRTLQNIAIEGELFVDNRTSYQFIPTQRPGAT